MSRLLRKYEQALPDGVAKARTPTLGRKIDGTVKQQIRKTLVLASMKEHGRLRCHWCDKTLIMKTVTLDHVVPMCVGGKKVSISNIVLSCHGCNQERGWIVHWFLNLERLRRDWQAFVCGKIQTTFEKFNAQRMRSLRKWRKHLPMIIELMRKHPDLAVRLPPEADERYRYHER